MTEARTTRLTNAADLGRAGRGLDIALGVGAMLPILALGWIAATVQGASLSSVKTAAAIWVGCLLAFLSGVRRGLSFSERSGARLTEIASFLGVFVIAIVTLILRSPGLGGVGLVVVGALDGAAAGRAQAPSYFRIFRPAQMLVGALGLLFVGAHTGF